MLTELITQSTVHTERPVVTKHIQQLDSVNQADGQFSSVYQVRSIHRAIRGYSVYRVNKVNEAIVFIE